MFRNYFKIALRNLNKFKLFSTINIIGLTVGVTASILIGLYINNELSYDKFNLNRERIVRATMEYGGSGNVSRAVVTGTKVGPEFKRKFPLVEEFTRTYIGHRNVKVGDHIFNEPRILFADKSFFKIFSFQLIEGNNSNVLSDQNNIVISQSMSQKYFGTENALNKTLSLEGKDYSITGVFKDTPSNSQLKFDFVTQFLNISKSVKIETWWNANWVTYFLLHEKNNIAVLQQQVNNYMQSSEIRSDASLEKSEYLNYHFEPLSSVHLHSSLAGFEPNGNITYLYIFFAISLLILVIVYANYTNLATVQSAIRSTEIGMRKIMGASKRMVFFQFIGEASIITFIGTVLGFILSILLIPYFNTITGKQFIVTDFFQPVLILSLIVFWIILSFFSGLYPGIILSNFRILKILKKGFTFSESNNILRKSLVVVQFGISIFLIIFTLIIMQQMNYMQTKNLGYTKEHVLVLPIGGSMLNNFQNIKDAIEKVKGVEAVTASYESPEFVEWGDGIVAIDENGEHKVSLNAMPVDLDFTKTMKMQLIAGRDFQQSDFALMDKVNNYANFQQPYIINETLAKKIGWTPKQSIGKIIKKGNPGPVVGVVKDFNFSSLHEPIGPLVMFLGRTYSRIFLIRLNTSNLQKTLGGLEVLWNQRISDRIFDYHFLDDDYNKLYQSEQRTSNLFTVAASLAIILACLGLFGLAAFTTAQRTKEIGVRRVLGANIKNIAFLISQSFVKLVGIGILIAFPLAWWAGNTWLQYFAFRIHIAWWVFLLTGISVLLIALLTVSYHAIKASIINPVNSLRTE